MVSKATNKAVLAARILGAKLEVSISQVLDSYTHRDIYLLMQADGYRWDSARECWQMRDIPMEKQPAKTLTPVHAQIRIMAQDSADCGTVLEAVKNAFTLMGYDVARVSAIKENYGGEGSRVYMDVLF